MPQCPYDFLSVNSNIEFEYLILRTSNILYGINLNICD